MTCNKIKETLLASLAQIEAEENRDPNNDIRIVILQRGWVMVGRYKRSDQYVSLENAAVVRVWGTTKGLGELASNGPNKGKTILEPVPVVEFHTLVEIANIRCNVANWVGKL